MCGIYASISRVAHHGPSEYLKTLLCRRGPDHAGIVTAKVNLDDGDDTFLSFYSTVLALRGGHVTPQPLIDPSTGSLLCWNGEAWKTGGTIVTGNDGEVILRQLATGASKASRVDSISYTLDVLRNISGPFAFVFFDQTHDLIYFGRDCLGRRSLLFNITGGDEGALEFSSVSDHAQGAWREVEADGIYMLVCKSPFENLPLPEEGILEKGFLFQTLRFSWSVGEVGRVGDTSLGLLNRCIPESKSEFSSLSESAGRLGRQLLESLKLRVLNIPSPGHEVPPDGVRLAVLFSGGLDCTVIARMAHDLLPVGQAIDLLNVAFENPRVIDAARKSQQSTGLVRSDTLKQTSLYELCPDRITGRNALRELRQTCPERVNVPYVEAGAHKSKVMSLIFPHNTEMDLSIAYALYFAARGCGLASTNDIDTAVPYTTQARVLLTGLGADELFGGYTRHATAFSRRGFPGLLNELQLDVDRLGKRNLGRDDRVLSNWGREARFPYLDESFVKWSLECPIWEKCGFGAEMGTIERPEDEIEPGKKALRLLAWQLGLHSVAKEKKRAIQFGARTAKMETGKTKGTAIIS
ncbi:MAG: hypothetical protein M1818_005259 [Claussenomyces sp. TS43310]|nr:MAG: hypothetical protein M1818_005259 [Claussenomyces sp. TS43310]